MVASEVHGAHQIYWDMRGSITNKVWFRSTWPDPMPSGEATKLSCSLMGWVVLSKRIGSHYHGRLNWRRAPIRVCRFQKLSDPSDMFVAVIWGLSPHSRCHYVGLQDTLIAGCKASWWIIWKRRSTSRYLVMKIHLMINLFHWRLLLVRIYSDLEVYLQISNLYQFLVVDDLLDVCWRLELSHSSIFIICAFIECNL